MERENERGLPWHMLDFVVCRGVAGAEARNNVAGSQGSRGGRSPKCNGSTDGRGATWQQMRAGGTAGRKKDDCESVSSESLRLRRATRTDKKKKKKERV